jgi:hypothetical protein
MNFDPYNCALKIQESIWESNSHNESSLGNVKVHFLTLFAFLGKCDMIPESYSWPATLQPLALVASPRLGLRHKLHFVTGLPNGSPEIPTAGTPMTLGAHNFACKPPIRMRSKAKLLP